MVQVQVNGGGEGAVSRAAGAAGSAECAGGACSSGAVHGATPVPFAAKACCAAAGDAAVAGRPAAVRVERFSFGYEGPDGAVRSVLDDVSFEVEEGAFCVIVGATGCGKTTLLRSLKPELAPVGVAAGDIAVLGKPLVRNGAPVSERDGGVSRVESAAQIGFVMQDPAMQIVCDTVWHELAFGLENLGTPQDEMRRRVAEVAHFFGIEPWVRRDTEGLSGGQKQIVNLAAVLALRPRVLLLDEPTAQLDPNALKRFLFLLARVNRELGITVVMATHAPEDVADYATCTIELGPVGELGSGERVREGLRPRWQARRERLAAARACAETARGRRGLRARAGRADEARAEAGAGAAADAGAPTGAGAPVEARGVFFRYRREAEWVLRGLDLAVVPGSAHAIVGGNGCGKSTLLKLLAQTEKPQRGTVANPYRAHQAYLPQDPKALLVCDSVIEELEEWRDRCGYGDAEVRAALARFGLAGFEAQHPYDLSGGQRQKLALAKLLLADPQLLFLDEPTKGLDPASCADAVRLVRALVDEGRTVVFVTHDLDFALAAADEVSMVFDGELACTEDVETFFRSNLVYRPNAASRLFGLL